ncbi:MAG: LysR substrate-binding domain-containing protein [Phycisphaerales bacterium]|nr:LysR substrate-binding domain-containing protein [Phycisphaerales bacterium]
MTLTQLEYAVAVATYHSFVAAAEKCFVTQPTLSMQIQKLEDELGIKLFDRNNRPNTVTTIGAPIIEQAKLILSECEKVYELVKKSQGIVAGMFKLAVIPSVAPYLMPGLLELYAQDYPDVRLQVKEMETDQVLAALKNNEIDAAIVSTPLENSGIQEYPLFYEPFVGYFSEGEKALKKKLIVASDIEMDRLLLLNEGHCMRNQILDLCSEHIHELQTNKSFQYDSSSVDTLRKLVDRNKGMTVLPELAVNDFTEDQQDRVRYFEDPEPVREISIVTNNQFVKVTLLQSLIDEILLLVPEKMRAQTKKRKILRIQSSQLG